MAVVLGVSYAAFVFPTRQLLNERSQLQGAHLQLTALQRENAALRRDVSNLSDPSFIASIAHSEYGLVGKGQTSYLILPSSPLYTPPSK